MKKEQKELQHKVDSLNENEKIVLVNYILENLDKPDPEIDKAWIKESKSRLTAMRAGKMKTYDYFDVMEIIRQKPLSFRPEVLSGKIAPDQSKQLILVDTSV